MAGPTIYPTSNEIIVGETYYIDDVFVYTKPNRFGQRLFDVRVIFYDTDGIDFHNAREYTDSISGRDVDSYSYHLLLSDPPELNTYPDDFPYPPFFGATVTITDANLILNGTFTWFYEDERSYWNHGYGYNRFTAPSNVVKLTDQEIFERNIDQFVGRNANYLPVDRIADRFPKVNQVDLTKPGDNRFEPFNDAIIKAREKLIDLMEVTASGISTSAGLKNIALKADDIEFQAFVKNASVGTLSQIGKAIKVLEVYDAVGEFAVRLGAGESVADAARDPVGRLAISLISGSAGEIGGLFVVGALGVTGVPAVVVGLGIGGLIGLGVDETLKWLKPDSGTKRVGPLSEVLTASAQAKNGIERWSYDPATGTGKLLDETDPDLFDAIVAALSGEAGAGALIEIADATTDDILGTAGDDIIELSASAGRTFGADGNDRISGGDAADRMYGGKGRDTISGGAGSDWLDGGAGRDRMIGGKGNDTYVVDSPHDVIVEAWRSGSDTVRSGVSWVLDANLEHLVLTGSRDLSGTGNARANKITGNRGDNTLSGGDGNDTLTGGPGKDRMEGGSGDDTYVVESARDVLIEVGRGGIDTVRSSVSWTLAPNFEHLVLTGSRDLSGTGNDRANELTGNRADNRLAGGAGNDIIFGGKGHDRLIGGMGRDTLRGGAGEDTFVFNSIEESGVGKYQRDLILDFKQGMDRIDLSRIDASIASSRDNKFEFIGTDPFSGQPRELRMSKAIIMGDVDGDGQADFQLALAARVALSEQDFIL